AAASGTCCSLPRCPSGPSSPPRRPRSPPCQDFRCASRSAFSIGSTPRSDVTLTWSLECSGCSAVRGADGLPGVCDACGQPYLVRYQAAPAPGAKDLIRRRPWTMWRYREWLPLADGEVPVTLGEGGTPLLSVSRAG